MEVQTCPRKLREKLHLEHEEDKAFRSVAVFLLGIEVNGVYMEVGSDSLTIFWTAGERLIKLVNVLVVLKKTELLSFVSTLKPFLTHR